MKNLIDLHIHSNFSSDGEYEPEKLIEIAQQQKLSAIALTDHNCMAGVDRAKKAGADLGIEVVPGIEIDTKLDGYDLHILGYYLDAENEKLNNMLDRMIELQFELAQKRVAKLQEISFNITYDEALEYASDVPVGVVLAETLIKNGRNQDNPLLKPYLAGGELSDQPYFNFHLNYFTRGKVAYLPYDNPSSDEVVGLILEIGGIPVLAHPGSALNPDKEEDLHIINKLRERGLIGLEAYSSYHSLEMMSKFADTGRKLDLVLTAGSDFHGKTKPKIMMGQVPKNDYQILENLKKYKS